MVNFALSTMRACRVRLFQPFWVENQSFSCCIRSSAPSSAHSARRSGSMRAHWSKWSKAGRQASRYASEYLENSERVTFLKLSGKLVTQAKTRSEKAANSSAVSPSTAGMGAGASASSCAWVSFVAQYMQAKRGSSPGICSFFPHLGQ